MSTTSDIDDDTLQRFYDGDLSPLEEHGVQARIERDPEAQRRLVELGRLTDVLRVAADELATQVNSGALFASIEQRLNAPDETGSGTRVRLIASEWFEHRRTALLPVLAATGMAAIALLAVLKPAAPTLVEPGSTNVTRAVPTAQLGTEQTTPSEVHGTRVEDVDFGTSTGTVFEIDNQGVATAVVWITDEDTL
jgi:anti-sigma factor RsiW